MSIDSLLTPVIDALIQYYPGLPVSLSHPLKKEAKDEKADKPSIKVKQQSFVVFNLGLTPIPTKQRTTIKTKVSIESSIE